MNNALLFLIILGIGILSYVGGVYIGIYLCRHYPILTFKKTDLKKTELKPCNKRN